MTDKELNKLQQLRFERHAIMEAYITVLVKCVQERNLDNYLEVIDMVKQSAESILELPRPIQKAA